MMKVDFFLESQDGDCQCACSVHSAVLNKKYLSVRSISCDQQVKVLKWVPSGNKEI